MLLTSLLTGFCLSGPKSLLSLWFTSHLLSLLSLSNSKAFLWCPEGQSEKAGIWVLIPHTQAWTLWDRYVNSQECSYLGVMHNKETGSFSKEACGA